MNLTPKEQAEQHRKIADAYVALADAFGPLHREAAKSFRVAAESYRKEADRIDPPQPEWQDGDLALDRDGELWQFDGDEWHLRSMQRSTASLIRDFGPIHKVHTADPAKHEVVVSLDGLDLKALLSYEDWDEDGGNLSIISRTGIRAAKAAREQLGEVQ